MKKDRTRQILPIEAKNANAVKKHKEIIIGFRHRLAAIKQLKNDP